MEKQLVKKMTTLGFLTAGFLSYLTINILFRSAAGVLPLAQRMYSIDMVGHGVPIAFGLLVFLLLQFNPKTLLWAEEVVLEVSKVVWPSQKDTVGMTIVVCVFVAIASALLVVIDFVAQGAVQFILSLQ